MENIFLEIFNMSITASYLALCVILLRFCLKKAPKWIMGILWAFVGFRLICPVSLESIFSLIPSAQTIPDDILVSDSPAIHSGIPYINSTLNPIIGETFAPSAAESANPMKLITFVAAIIWLVGVFTMLLYSVISYIKIKRNLREAAHFKDNIYLCDTVETPFILGAVKPKIYLPSDIKEAEIEYVTAHENAHIKRHDHLWKPLGFLLLSVYWFNPVLWLAYILLCKDIELACDEKVIKELGENAKKPYSEALINCSIKKKTISACPLAFGETGTKERIKNVLSYKKPAFWTIIVGIIIIVVIAVCLLTNPKGVNSNATYLKDVENMNLETCIENTVSILHGNGEAFSEIPLFDKEHLKDLLYIRVNPEAISANRSENRDKSVTLVLQNSNNSNNKAKTTGVFIHFNKELSEVWIDDGVKPTLTYDIIEPSEVNIFLHKTVDMVFFDRNNIKEEITNEIQPIDFADGYGEKALKTAFGNNYEILLKRKYSPAESISSLRYAYLVEANSKTYLVVEDTTKIYFKDITLDVPAILGMEMETCDVATNEEFKKSEIILHQCVGMSGGAGSYVSRIYKVTDYGIQLIYTDEHGGTDVGFKATIKDGFKMELKNRYTNQEQTVDLSDRKWYWGVYFSKDGKALKQSTEISVDSPYLFFAKDVDNDEVYEIISMHYTSLQGHTDHIGTTVCTLKFNKASGKFEIIDAKLVTEKNELEQIKSATYVIDATSYDVDGDGIKENCSITANEHYGKQSFELFIAKSDTTSYYGKFEYDIFPKGFVTENGKLQLIFQITEDGETVQHIMDVLLENNGTIELVDTEEYPITPNNIVNQ